MRCAAMDPLSQPVRLTAHLRAKSRRWRLRSETRLRAQPFSKGELGCSADLPGCRGNCSPPRSGEFRVLPVRAPPYIKGELGGVLRGSMRQSVK